MLYSNEDLVVCGKVLAVLGELGNAHLLQGLAPVVWNYGPHRFYQWELVSRDDEPFDSETFYKLLAALNSVGKIKPQIHSIEDYPEEVRYFTRYYLSVYI